VPRVIHCPDEDAIELGDLVAALNAEDFDPTDEDSFAAAGPLLKRLANNRDFLADVAVAELKDRCTRQSLENRYSSQVIMLHRASEKYYIRANFWPSERDSVFKASGNSPFYYHVPHDHNFSFLTVGYLGPGYWSDYYEYDYRKVVGYPGEPVDLKFIEKSRLEQGKVMLYRAHKDIHLQLPADAMSVSLNIVEAAHSSAFRDQYRFDLATNTVDGIITRMSLEPMLALAAHYGGEEGMDLIDTFVGGHPSDRIRWSALRARAAAAPSLDARIQVFEDGARTDSRLVSAMAKREIARLEAGRAWIEGAPLREVAA